MAIRCLAGLGATGGAISLYSCAQHIAVLTPRFPNDNGLQQALYRDSDVHSRQSLLGG